MGEKPQKICRRSSIEPGGCGDGCAGHRGGQAGTHRYPGTKKKIEISRPIKKITVDTSHLPPKPVETTSLPEGSFCGRCGNRIPPGSTFCNRCGTKVVAPGEGAAVSAAPGQIAMAPAIASGPGDRKGRPIEQIIHSIEPLIEDSVPRTEAAPAVT